MFVETGIESPGVGSGHRSGVSVGQFWLLLLAVTLGKAVLAAVVPISGDEAYYYDCSRYPDWASFDQPCLVIWAMIPSRWAFGENALGVRAPALLASLLLGFFLERICRRLGGTRRHAASAWGILHATPLFLLGSAYASTDALMNSAYAAVTWAAIAIAQGERRAWWGFGLAMGLGFLAKFPVVLALAMLVPVLMQPSARRDLRTATPWLAALLSLALTAPVWIWGSQHHWDNIAFQFRRVPEGFDPVYMLGFLALNLVLTSIAIGIGVVLAWFRSLPTKSVGWGVYRIAVATPIVVWTYAALRGKVGGHWAAATFLVGVVGFVLVRTPARRGLVRVGAGLCAVTVLLGFSVLSFPEFWLREELRLRHWRGLDERGLKLVSLVGNQELADGLAKRRRPGEFVASSSYTETHLLSFLSRGELPMRLAHLGGKHGLASLYFHPIGELEGRDFLFFSRRDDVLDRVLDRFAAHSELEPIEIRRDGKVIRRWRVFRCRDLQDARGMFTRLDEIP